MEDLKEKRLKKGMTQIELAIQLGVSLSTYRLIEYGAQKPNSDVKEKLEKLFSDK